MRWYQSGASERHTNRHDSYPITDLAIRSAKRREKAYKVSDSGGLHLLINPGGSKLWRLAYRYGGKQKLLALGGYPAVSLSEAREKREAAKKASPRRGGCGGRSRDRPNHRSAHRDAGSWSGRRPDRARASR
ncbi:MAG: DUF4102 domain-containing protein [Rhizobiales bacterium]|nr:DUF4102 domain-containing protein [Hyphomicrobiales bacterium]